MSEIDPSNQARTSAPFAPTLLGAFAVVCVLGALFYYFYWDRDTATESANITASYRGTLVNQDFAQGEELRLDGNLDASVEYFEKALTQVGDAPEAGMIQLRIALAKQRGGAADQLEAVRVFKEVAANTSYSLQVRAYAVHNMSSLLSTSAFDPVLAYEVFKDPPYNQMVSKTRSIMSRRLAEYASSLYPIAGAEFNLAYLYAREVQRARDASVPDEEKAASYISLVREKIRSGDRDLAVIQRQHENYASTIPYILLQKAKALGIMEMVGETDFSDADAAYEEALAAYAAYSTPGGDGYVRYYYALYVLGTQGTGGYQKVREILSPIYNTDQYAGRPFEEYLADARTNLDVTKERIASLAVADADFEKYLASLGWTEADLGA